MERVVLVEKECFILFLLLIFGLHFTEMWSAMWNNAEFVKPLRVKLPTLVFTCLCPFQRSLGPILAWTLFSAYLALKRVMILFSWWLIIFLRWLTLSHAKELPMQFKWPNCSSRKSTTFIVSLLLSFPIEILAS